MNTLTSAEARDRMPQLLNEVTHPPHRITITRAGGPDAILIGPWDPVFEYLLTKRREEAFDELIKRSRIGAFDEIADPECEHEAWG
jgi:prevent-host-death family protein